MAQATPKVEHGRLDLMSLTETILMKAYFNNRWYYKVIYYVARTSRAGGAQGGKGLVSQDRYNGWGRESMCFHRPNVVIYDIVWKVSDVEAG